MMSRLISQQRVTERKREYGFFSITRIPYSRYKIAMVSLTSDFCKFYTGSHSKAGDWVTGKTSSLLRDVFQQTATRWLYFALSPPKDFYNFHFLRDFNFGL